MTFNEIEQKLAEKKYTISHDAFMLLLVNILFGMWRDYREINGAHSE